MPSWQLFYGRMKRGVELSFLGFVDPFSNLVGALVWARRSAAAVAASSSRNTVSFSSARTFLGGYYTTKLTANS
jgi:hypothetical protein